MLTNIHKGRIFPIKDIPIPLFLDSLECIKKKEIDDRMLGEISSPRAQEGVEVVRVLWREKVIYITKVNNDLLPKKEMDKEVMHTVFT